MKFQVSFDELRNYHIVIIITKFFPNHLQPFISHIFPISLICASQRMTSKQLPPNTMRLRNWFLFLKKISDQAWHNILRFWKVTVGLFSEKKKIGNENFRALES